MPERHPLGTTKEIADYVGVPDATVVNWRYRGGGPVFIRVGRQIRYRWTDVERWLESQEAGGDAA